ncbi:uncharacterized protein [Trachinotus anak]|uniref:uncharacterized protein n=1 Tax=Trachinotus anak TaxID=443729 RepID=UPI0039F1D0F6
MWTWRTPPQPTAKTLRTQLETLKRDDRGSEQGANQVNEVTASSVVSCSQEKEGPPEKNWSSPVHSERDALLVGVLCFINGIIPTFLHVHPFGASIEYICSYLRCLDTKMLFEVDGGFIPPAAGRGTTDLPCGQNLVCLDPPDNSCSTFVKNKNLRIRFTPGGVEALLSQLPYTFRQELTGVSLEKTLGLLQLPGHQKHIDSAVTLLGRGRSKRWRRQHRYNQDSVEMWKKPRDKSTNYSPQISDQERVLCRWQRDKYAGFCDGKLIGSISMVTKRWMYLYGDCCIISHSFFYS